MVERMVPLDAKTDEHRSALPLQLQPIPKNLHGDDENHMLDIVVVEQIINAQVIQRQRVFKENPVLALIDELIYTNPI
jgi:hypothetical protein